MTADFSGLTGGDAVVAVSTITAGSPTQNEKQTLDLYGTPTGGTLTLTFENLTTAGIAYNAAAAAVDSALEALPNLLVGDVTVTGGPLPGSTVTVEFTGTRGQCRPATPLDQPGRFDGRIDRRQRRNVARRQQSDQCDLSVLRYLSDGDDRAPAVDGQCLCLSGYIYAYL